MKMTAPPAPSVSDLLDLARQRTAAGRAELFATMSDLLTEADARPSERERALLAGILRSLLGRVEMELRRSLAVRLAARGDVPEDLVADLARDDIEIARPLLMGSPVLKDATLIEIIRLRGAEHTLAITLRPSLSSAVGDAVVATGDADAIESLLNNQSAELSTQAMDYLVAEAQRIDRFRGPLVGRADLPGDLAMRLYWHVSAALRQHLIARLDLAEAVVDDLIEETAEGLAGAGGGEGLQGAARRLADGLAGSGGLTGETLAGLLRSARIPAFVAGLARLSQCPEPIVRRVALTADGETLAVICKAAGIHRNDFATIYLLVRKGRDAGRPMPTRRLNALVDFYDALGGDGARAAVAYWRRDPGYRAAIEAVALAGIGAAGGAP
jgi:uncharacterized protein (DUF2336 family)